MLRLIPPPLHRAALIVAHRLRLWWWRLRKPLLVGCRILAFDEDERILLVRHSYGSGRWMLPGGGVARGEPPLSAAQRELREEVGCTLARAHLFLEIDEPLSGTTNRVHLVCGDAVGTLRPDRREIMEAVFHDPAALPENMAAALVAGLPEWITAAKAARHLPPAAD
ncbi:MAG: NUDIX domain-containing protein [Sphingomonadales bacterium]|nr:NUDIX domain-containing protein [Sphingomonadales bacterium]